MAPRAAGKGDERAPWSAARERPARAPAPGSLACAAHGPLL